MRYSLIREMDVSNGQGVGVSLFVQGCHFQCPGCFNQETWDFSGGKEWNGETEAKFLSLANRPYIQRISILGGEPLADENVETVTGLLQTLKVRYPQKKLWLYTGYTWEACMGTKRETALRLADVVVDGPFQLEKQDMFNKEIVFAGSTNQRVINSQRSFALGQVVRL